MPALEDWELWLRIARKHKIACVSQPLLVVYTQINRDHVGGSRERLLAALKRIESKNIDSFVANKYAYWQIMKLIVAYHVSLNEHKLALKTWFRAMKLQPYRLTGNILMLARAYLGKCKRVLLAYILRKQPKLFYRMKIYVNKLKGEYVN